MDQETHDALGGEQSRIVAAYIARHLKRGVSPEKIRKALEHNDWDERIFDRAFAKAQQLIDEEAEAKKAAEAAKEAARRAKRSRRHKKADKPEAHSIFDEENDKKDEEQSESSNGAESFAQDEAVLLHAPPKPHKPMRTDRGWDDESNEVSEDETVLDLRALAREAFDGDHDTQSHYQHQGLSNEALLRLEKDLGSEAVLGHLPGNEDDPGQPNYPPAPGFAPIKPLSQPYPGPTWPSSPADMASGNYAYTYPYPTRDWRSAPAMPGSQYPANAYPYPYPAPGTYPYPGAPYGYQINPTFAPGPPGGAWNTVPAGYSGYQPPAPPAGGIVVGYGFDPTTANALAAANQDQRQPATSRGRGHTISRLRSTSHQTGEQYNLGQALVDSYQAVANNVVNFALSIVISYAASGAMFFLALLVIHKLFSLKYNVLLIVPIKVFVAAFGSLAVYALFYILAGTVTISLSTLALADGDQQRQRPITVLLRRAIGQSGRVGSALILTGAIIFLPAALIVIIPTIVLLAAHGANLLGHLMPFLYGAAFIWILMASMRYALAPYVALFGRDSHISRTLGKSHTLLTGSGQWLVAKIIMGLAVVAVGLSLVTGHGWQRTVSNSNPWISGTMAILFIGVNSVLAMTYRTQKAARSRNQGYHS